LRGYGQIDSRRFQKRIEIFSLSEQNDGFGGKTVVEVSLGFYWANWRTVSDNSKTITNLQGLGLKDFGQIFKVTLRANVLVEDIEKVRIKYNGIVYDIVSISEIDIRNIKTVLILKEHRVE